MLEFYPGDQLGKEHDPLRPRFGADQDNNPGDDPSKMTSAQFDQQPMDSPRIQVPQAQQPQ